MAKGGKRGGAARPGWGLALARDLVAAGRLPPSALEPRTTASAPISPTPATLPAVMVAERPVRRSKTEERYEQRLVAEGYRPRYEALRLRIELPTGQHHYKPDFYIDAPGGPELHEVKGGYPRQRDWMRFEMAVAAWGHVFAFVWAQWKSGEWHVRRFERRGEAS
jgi:hypothetical protein